MRRPLLAAALAALVLTAGCSFLGGGGGTPAGGSQTPTPTASATTTPTPTPTSSAYPSGYNDSGVADPAAAIAAHVDTLTNRRSFIVAVNGSVATENGTRALAQIQSVDIEDDRALIAVNESAGVARTSYFGDGKRYLRVDPPGENDTRYNVTNATLEPRGFAGSSFIAPLLTNVTYDPVNVTETENGTFYSYRAASVDQSSFPALFGPSVDPENVTRFEAGLVVDQSGIVRRASYRAVVDRGDRQLVVQVHMQTYAIDEVDISEPPWLDEARRSDS